MTTLHPEYQSYINQQKSSMNNVRTGSSCTCTQKQGCLFFLLFSAIFIIHCIAFGGWGLTMDPENKESKKDKKKAKKCT